MSCQRWSGCRTAIAALSAAVALAACGSSNKASNGLPDRNRALAFARCLRVHGVPNFPDLSPSGPPRIPSTVDTETPAFRAAQRACTSLTPGGEGGGGTSSESRRLELLAIAKCMRAHGVPDFSDPTSSPPPPGHGNALGGDGVYLAVGLPPAEQSPAFKAAAGVCRLP